MSLKWPEKMSSDKNGRLSKEENDAAWATGIVRVMDAKMSCPQTLHITLFFDGTNNNDAEDNVWRDSKKKTHTNVARLFNAARDEKEHGIFPYYIPGVGTPFPQIGEPLYTSMGKAMAKGFSARCVWGYTRVLNAVYSAINTDRTRGELIPVEDAHWLCDAGATGNMEGFKPYLDRLGVAHKQAVDEHAWPRTVKQIWINVIGFSRGAAGARAFVHKLINKWAPGGRLSDQTGKYALPYTVNFMGLFDTVASVGPPDSMRATLNVDSIAGHYAFAGDGAMEIPKAVNFCVHAFSIHEQRMSFPLDSIRKKGDTDPGECRQEIAYPGVHSDVGGGYAPGEQGKGRDGDSSKLSQIPLHDMYVAALKYGVPLMRGEAILGTPRIAPDFALNLSTIEAFNAWLKTAKTEPIPCIADAMKFGMGQMLSWRTLRAEFKTGNYVTAQEFFAKATENPLAPYQVSKRVEQAQKADAELQKLETQLSQAKGNQLQAINSARYPDNMSAVIEANLQVEDAETAVRIRKEAICGEVAHPDAKPEANPGALPNSARPGETAWDVVTNDKTDLRQGAEEMRLLLAHLYPDQLERWKVQKTVPTNPSRNTYPPEPMRPVLSVQHEEQRKGNSVQQAEQRKGNSPQMTLVERASILGHVVRTTIIRAYDVEDDVLAEPVEKAKPFLKKHTSPEAVKCLPVAAIDLFDNYVHDSRAWFRVPYFHEYAPGGFFWPRVVFVGGDTRLAWLGFDPLFVALDAQSPAETAFA